MKRWLTFLWCWVLAFGIIQVASATESAQADSLTELYLFDSGAAVAYDPAWKSSGDGQRATFETSTFSLTVYDYAYWQSYALTISSPPEAILEEAFYDVILDTKQAFDSVLLSTDEATGRMFTVYAHEDGTGAYLWAHVPFSNGQFGVVLMQGATLDEAIFYAVAATFDNAQSTDGTPPPSGGRADLAREIIDIENGPLDMRFRAEEVEFSFGYPETWVIEQRDTGEVIASFEETRVTFFGQAFLQQNDLASVPTLEELVEDAAARLGGYTLGERLIFKAEGRPAVQYDAVAPDGGTVLIVGTTFSDDRLGLALIENAESGLLEEVVYLMLDTFDIAPVQVAPLTQSYVSDNLTYTLNYPQEWSVTPVAEGAYVAFSDGQIAVNIYGTNGIVAQGIVAESPVTLCEDVIALIGWTFDPAVRLRVDNRPAARLIYENPVYETQGRLYAILLDGEARTYGYFDVVPLNDAASVALYEDIVLEMLATFRAVESDTEGT